MDFSKDLFSKDIFSFEGRINRAKYWTISLLLCCPLLFFWLIGLILPIFFVPVGIYALFILWPSLATVGKRWHDRDKSAWWILIALIPVIGTIWTFVEAGCLKGTEGPNRFGPDPLA